jgi:2'-5' RNA ligase
MSQLDLPGFGGGSPGAPPSRPARSPGGPRKPKPDQRYFFGAFPGVARAEPFLRAARRIQDEAGVVAKPIEVGRSHCTIHLVGDFLRPLPEDFIARLIRAMDDIRFGSFPVGFGRVANYGHGGRAVVLEATEGLADLAELHRLVLSALVRHGLSPVRSLDYRPHVTLFYSDQKVSERLIEPARWLVTEFSLVHSLLGKTQHTHLARWRAEDANEEEALASAET